MKKIDLGQLLFASIFVLPVFGIAPCLAQTLAVDHVWIQVESEQPLEILEAAGLQLATFGGALLGEGDSPFAPHVGQGTASTGVRFENIYLELIRVEDATLLRDAAPEEFWSVLLNRPESSPFGIGLRKTQETLADLPFAYTSYWATWMRPLVSISVAERHAANQSDPAIFVVPDYMRWDTRIEAQPELLAEAVHPLGVGDVTGIRIHGPGLPSDAEAMTYLTSNGLVEFVNSDSYLLELEFDGETDRLVDLRPELPLVI